MTKTDWKQVVERWRKLPKAEKHAIRWQRIPRSVTGSMAFEREPVSLAMVETEHARLTVPPTTSKPALAS